MPRLPTQARPQLTNPRVGGTHDKGSRVSATQFVIGITTFGVLFLALNVYYLLSKGGLNDPLPPVQPLQERKATSASSSPPIGPDVQYHVIFSTGCSPKQDFQSYVFFFHALKSKQPGIITRIAACKDDEGAALMEYHKEFIQPMSPNFLLHITPDYSEIKGAGTPFHYFNKPFSCHHWMEHALGYGPKPKQLGDNPNDNTIVILCDPDQIIMRPFTNNQFEDNPKLWMERTTHPIIRYVDHGKPMGQFYGFGDQWKTKTNITRYVPKEELPSFVQTMSKEEKNQNYAVGPPYIVTAFDFYTIVTRWKAFVPLVHDDYPHLLAEMFAYCLAAAHSRLPHQVATGLMVSDVTAFGLEGWDLMSEDSPRAMCTPGALPETHLPYILHYCQRYGLGKWVIGKHRIPPEFFSCETPLLAEPPEDIGEKFNFMIEPDRNTDLKRKLPLSTIKNEAFMLCHLIPYLNEAATYWKDNHCSGKSPNKLKTKTFFDNMEVAAHFFEED
jgi:peptidyl serine alpha-galactosyltransferase